MFKNFKLVVSFLLITPLFAQTTSPLYKDSLQSQWVDDIYNQMSLDEKLGQLFMVAAYSNKGATHEAEIKQLIANEHIGGLIFMQDDYNHQAELTNQYQNMSKYPLLIGMDAEYDVSMRLKDTNRFPWAMTMGAVTDNELIYETGERIAYHLQALGAHFNFAPVVDVNVNPLNPIIGNRSFGSDPNNVATKGIFYAKGMQDNFILASAKHFPGHGDTSQDSHKTLPVISHNRARLDSIELAPFRKLIEKGVASIMVAHLNVPALEPNPKIPSSLSKKIVTGILKDEMGFQGIIITDALNMRGVTSQFPNGQTDLMAFEAGNDILLFSQAVAKGKAKIIDAINKGKIPMSRVEESVKKILMAKYYVGLNKDFVPIETQYLAQDLNDPQSKALTHRIFEDAATLLKNKDNILPIQNLVGKKFGFIGLEEGDHQPFLTYLRKYAAIDEIKLRNQDNFDVISNYDYVFIGLHKNNSTPYKSYKISSQSKSIIRKIAAKTQAVLTLFGSPYGLKNIDTSDLDALLVMYQNHDAAMKVAPQVIFGAIPAKGSLPADVSMEYKAGTCLETQAIERLGYTEPENVGIRSEGLKYIDDIANYAMRIDATPGMQVLVARDGKVFFDKTYGYHTYEGKKKVKWDDLYDIASITKIVATVPLLMQKVDEGKLDTNARLSSILPDAVYTNKGNIKIQEILAHQGGLYPWIPFFRETLDSVSYAYLPNYYAKEPSPKYGLKVADDLYILNSYRDSIKKKIYEKELIPKRYRYSDLGYYLFKEYLENEAQASLDLQTQRHFYLPMGMNHTLYNPLRVFSKERIVPTENDFIFRKQLIHGHVHDQGAAMSGGVGGHAGVFSNANDLAKMMQMYLNGGSYGGEKYIDENTLNRFTRYQFKRNRRGMGFDKQLRESGPTCKCVTWKSYGHTGFTGTMVWVDPEEKIVYVFLSNRVHPDADNRKLIREDIREKIQQQIYSSLLWRH